ncbi:hypothetical protein LINPERPRIM_LOCUS39898 [Linum perenne]
MPPFAFKSNNHFVASSDGTILQVYELTKPTIHLSSIKKADWKKIATIDMVPDDDVDEEDDEADDGVTYDGLVFFDGHGRIEGRKTLTMLAQHLKHLHLLVSPEGYCVQEVSEFGVYSEYGIHYLRLNDLFSWPRHGVDLATTHMWSRLELKYSLPKHKPVEANRAMDEELQKLKRKEEEMQKVINKNKDVEEAKTSRIEELEKLKEEMTNETEAKNEELRKTKKDMNAELQTRKKDEDRRIKELEKLNEAKDEELQKLKKEEQNSSTKQTAELEKLKEEMKDAIEAKNEEIQKMRKDTNAELQTWKKDENRRVADLEKQNEAKDEELRKLRKEFAKSKQEMEESGNEAMEMLRKEKMEELNKVLKEKSDEEGKAKKMGDELVMLRNKVRLLTMRRTFPPQSITFRPLPHNNFPKFLDRLLGYEVIRVTFVDDVSYKRPLQDTLVLYNSGEVFDVDNWWTLRVYEPSGQLVMLAYYEGSRSQVSLRGSNEGTVVSIPFGNDTSVVPFNRTFVIVRLDPAGVKLGFFF